MIVVGHLAERVTAPLEPFADLAEQRQPRNAIVVIEKDRLAPVSAGSDVIQPAGQLDSQGPRHT